MMRESIPKQVDKKSVVTEEEEEEEEEEEGSGALKAEIRV